MFDLLGQTIKNIPLPEHQILPDFHLLFIDVVNF